jgi:hypothetical protein
MKISTLRTLASALLAGLATTAMALPHAIRYTGTVSVTNNMPEVTTGEQYTVTFIFDNGGPNAHTQSWGAAHLTCTIWRMNNNASVVYTQDLAAAPPPVVVGAITTDAGGALTSMFSQVHSQAVANGGVVPASAYSGVGFTPTPPVAWFAVQSNGRVFNNGSTFFWDASGNGIAMDTASWTAPQTVAGPCDDTPAPPGPDPVDPPPPTHATPVPTLGHGALALLAALTGAAGWRARRGRPTMRRHGNRHP